MMQELDKEVVLFVCIEYVSHVNVYHSFIRILLSRYIKIMRVFSANNLCTL